MKKLALYGVLAALMMVGLTACGGNAPAAQPTSPDTTTTTTDNHAESAAESTGQEFVHYTVTLGDAATGKFEGTSAVIALGDKRLISLIGTDAMTQAILQLPASVAPGQYVLARSGDYLAQIATSYDDSGNYTSDVSGTLNITSSDPLQGSFEFSAKTKAGATATASGSFEEMVYSYNISVTGAVETTLPPGVINAIVFQDEFAMNFESDGSAAEGFSLSFYLPNTIAAGEFGLATTFPKPAEDQVGIIINHHAAAKVTAYDVNITGTLTLTDVDGKFTGSFKGSAASSDGKTINFEGSFTDIPLVIAHDIP